MKARNTDKILLKLPVPFGWVEYKGETVAIQTNYEATQKAGKPMVDIGYCLTKLWNGIIDQTVQWDKSKFKPSKMEKTQWTSPKK